MDSYSDSVKFCDELGKEVNERAGRPVESTFLNAYDDKNLEADNTASVIVIIMDIIAMVAAVVICQLLL